MKCQEGMFWSLVGCSSFFSHVYFVIEALYAQTVLVLSSANLSSGFL